MSMLTNFLANRCSVSFLQAFRNEPNPALRRFFSSRPNFDTYAGVPEYPTPGTNDYTKSMERLQDPRFLEMLSGKNSQSFNPSEMKLQQWMQSISDQNAQLLREVNRLTQKVEQLENRFGTS